MIIKQTNVFRRDLKRAQKRGKDMEKLYAIIEKLTNQQPLAQKHKPHPLTGAWRPAWECHIEPDWLLVYHVQEDCLELISMGSHADLFG